MQLVTSSHAMVFHSIMTGLHVTSCMHWEMGNVVFLLWLIIVV